MKQGSRHEVPPSRAFTYAGDALHAEGVALADVAAAAGTPCFVYSGRAIDEAYASVDAALSFAPHLVAYAVKANGLLAIVSRLARAGAGADIVSGGELAKVLRAGVPAERIVFSGVGKTAPEIDAALTAGIRSIVVESAPELDAIERVAAARGTKARLSLRINPDIDARTHPYIATGLHDTKFGLELEAAARLVPRILASPHLSLEAITSHIGSQIGEASALADAVAVATRFACSCREQGAPIRSIDAGGGWPIGYGDEDASFDPASAFGAAIREGIARGGGTGLGLDVVVETGRALIGDAGVLLTRVLYVKDQGKKRFVIVDAAMTELIRPALYSAYHAIMPVRAAAADAPMAPADVVGPVCETADFLALDRPLPALSAGDLIALRGTGAYASSMSSRYNGRLRAAEVLVDGAAFRVVRERERVEDLWRGETP